MLESKKIELRRSEIRQELATLAGKDAPSEDEVRKMGELDREYRTLEARYRAALIAEEEERREAGEELETRDGREWAELVGRFEMRQVALALDEGRALDGATAEIVAELRAAGGYQGLPVPWEALEQRVGETVASGTPVPTMTAPILDRLFPASVAGRMGVRFIQIGSGEAEYPVTTSSVSAGWQDGETGDVAGPTVYATTNRALKPEQTLGIQMKVTRKALRQTGAALEAAVRRDMNSAIAAELDKAVFLGAGSSGEPLGVIAGAGTYGITSTAVDAEATSAAFRAALARFMTANAATGGDQVRLLARPELWAFMDDQQSVLPDLTEWDRLLRAIPAGNTTLSANALAAPAGSPVASTALLTTATGGVAPIYLGAWGAVDMIRDPFSDAKSGGLRITALTTMDVTVSRPAQLELLTGLQHAAA